MTDVPDLREPLCNLCGLTCMLWGRDTGVVDADGLVAAKVSGGYASTPGNGNGALDDMTTYSFSLCEFCLDWLFAQFHVPVTVGDAHDGMATLQPGETIEEGLKRAGGCIGYPHAPGPPEPPWKPAAERVKADAWREQKKRFFDDKARRDLARQKGPGYQAACDKHRLNLIEKGHCMADGDGDCAWAECPQTRDKEPQTSRRHCPRDIATRARLDPDDEGRSGDG